MYSMHTAPAMNALWKRAILDCTCSISRGIKTTKKEVIKRKVRNWEDKQLFGNLLESSKEQPRLLEKEGLISSVSELSKVKQISPNVCIPLTSVNFKTQDVHLLNVLPATGKNITAKQIKEKDKSEEKKVKSKRKVIKESKTSTLPVVPEQSETVTHPVNDDHKFDDSPAIKIANVTSRGFVADTELKSSEAVHHEYPTTYINSTKNNPGKNTVDENIPSKSENNKLDTMPSDNSKSKASVSETGDKNQVPKKSSKGSGLIVLPDIIIKNITSFPMLNFNNVNQDPNQEIPAPFENQQLRPYPSVSKVLGVTTPEKSRAMLMKWRQKMIATLGKDGFVEYYKNTLAQGTQFHSLVQHYLLGQALTEQLQPAVEGCWESMRDVLPYVNNVIALEAPVLHSQLLYRGIVDCIAEYHGEPVIIEWKKSSTRKSEIEQTYDAPLQTAAYLGACNFDPHFTTQLQGGVVVVAYTDGAPADVYHLKLADCFPYWTSWLTRLQEFWQMPNENRTSTTTMMFK